MSETCFEIRQECLPQYRSLKVRASAESQMVILLVVILTVQEQILKGLTLNPILVKLAKEVNVTETHQRVGEYVGRLIQTALSEPEEMLTETLMVKS